MTVSQQQTNTGKYHSLLHELKIGGGVEPNANPNEIKTDDAISPSDVLSFLLENGVLAEESLRSAVRTMRRKRKATNDSSRKSDRNDVAQVPIANNDVNAKNQNKGAISGPVPKKSVASALNQNSTDTTRTRHVALRIFYDGATYSGLAQNVGDERDNSVERCLFDALRKARLIVSRETSNYSRCGRTDRGVSSAGQVVALHLRSAFPRNAAWDEDGTSLLEAKDLPNNEHESRKVWTVPRSKKKKGKAKKLNNNDEDNSEATTKRIERDINEYSYPKILNNILPPSIRILGWTPVTEEFSARFSAGARTYRYFFCKRRMHANAIQEGLGRLVGKHDFRNLCKMDVEKVYNFERLIHSAELVEVQEPGTATKNGELCYLKIVGQAFLWHQIRCIAEVIFMIGNGLESPDIISELLDVKKHPGKPSYSLADEKPLVLHDCVYPNLHFGYSVQNLWTVSCQLEKQWEELTLAATRIRSGIESIRSCPISTNNMLTFATSKITERRKKLERRGIYEVVDIDSQIAMNGSSKAMSWGDALSWLEKHNLVPCPAGLTNSVHVPLMQRSMGPSYEEKVENLKKSEKRRLKFEENTIKKRKTAEEDKAFYDHKIKQGGTGI
jgi:tRNA pseudouridine38/39 synthase